MGTMQRGYSADHHRVYRERGKARDYKCAQDCGRQAMQWAQTHGTDGKSPEDYRPLCRSCHAKYDGAVPPLQTGRIPANSRFTDAEAEVIKQLVASGMTQRAVAKQMGCSVYPIWCIVHGVSHNRGDSQ